MYKKLFAALAAVAVSVAVAVPAYAEPSPPPKPKKNCYTFNEKRYCCPEGTVGVKVEGSDTPKCAHRPKKK